MKISSKIAIGILSTALFAFGVTQIAVCWAYKNVKTEHSWAYYANGICCLFTGVVGMLSTIFRREKLTQLFFIMAVLTTLEAFIVFIIYSKFLPRYIKNSCGGTSIYSEYCSGIRQYLAVSTTLFWSFIIFLLPTTSVASWKYTVATMKGNDDGIELEKRLP
ncbi:hypothetical protein PPL_09139 [Heterostelium album PN500]|uniref:Uncharacterized protein n=1 Tax=Heterostelium pallidum (strain ATCC 26659 / Pp 5 / PN500) TaxID=670386 RepID=D3BKQ7_HETP5|nr:hypothetical protein PPL_09139 [Heterostelium album PN500]EFA78487.1 hypothetical protein PPL_09139 [Heterostelium album PN500]|eukprot:XP_020430611.1 hypothetical protein PPL_09139 [Heterostelium album PN500]